MAAGVYTLIIFVYLYHSRLSRIFPDIYSLTGFDFYVSLSIGYLNVCLFHIQIYYIYRELLILSPIISLLTAFHLHPFFCCAMFLYSTSIVQGTGIGADYTSFTDMDSSDCPLGFITPSGTRKAVSMRVRT